MWCKINQFIMAFLRQFAVLPNFKIIVNNLPLIPYLNKWKLFNTTKFLFLWHATLATLTVTNLLYSKFKRSRDKPSNV